MITDGPFIRYTKDTIHNSMSWSHRTMWTKGVNKSPNLCQRPKYLRTSAQTQSSCDIAIVTWATAIPPTQGRTPVFPWAQLGSFSLIDSCPFLFPTLCFLRLGWASFLGPCLSMPYFKGKHLCFGCFMFCLGGWRYVAQVSHGEAGVMIWFRERWVKKQEM